jgi:RsiW-degrading membrane proteinase PrsW (M82 family)
LALLVDLLAALVAVGVPVLFLVLIYTLDLYASRTFRLVVLCFGWGAVGAVSLAYLINTAVGLPLARQLSARPALFLVIAFAPVVEEILKALVLLTVARRSEFTYFGDGAIYGFASGIGFSIVENFQYMSQHPAVMIPLLLVRTFSTCLVHGTATGLVGTALGRFRFHPRSRRWLGLAGGAVAAILLHAAFNAVTQVDAYAGAAIGVSISGGALVFVGMGIGLAGVGLIAFFVLLGLREERRWLAETLDRELGMTEREVRAVQAYGNLERVLKPIARKFPRKERQVEDLLLREAQAGIKLRVQERLDDPQQRKRLAEDVAELEEEIAHLRHEVGACVLTYVRCVLPEGALDTSCKWELLTACTGSPDLQPLAEVLSDSVRRPPRRDLLSRLWNRFASRGGTDGSP